MVPASPVLVTLRRSAMSDFIAGPYSSHSGRRHTRSYVALPAWLSRAASRSSFVMSPIASPPSATTQAPVSVARSIVASGLKRLA